VSWQLKSKELGQPGQKTGVGTYLKQDERIKRIIKQYDKSNDLYKVSKG
jgi:hypothetical protein